MNLCCIIKKKMVLYKRLAIIVKDFADKRNQERAEESFHTISTKTQLATILKQQLEMDNQGEVEIVSAVRNISTD
ncbi:MAG: hypothetical protein ACFFFG_06070 [Candidatus Thorarchaeota archaeon]